MSPVRQYAPEQQAFFPAVAPELSPNELDTQARLQALRVDPRAGFLPTTNAEKNQALAMLDYIENPQYPAGIGNQLQEIFLHQKQAYGVDEARRALMSVALEYGDYLANAVEQLAVLRELEEAIRNCPNPAVTLVAELGPEHKGFAPFVRFLDLSEMRDKGYVTGARFSPLRSWSDRSRPDNERNKYIEDPYTMKDRRALVTKRINYKADTITIGDARHPVSDAVADQELRRVFWEKRMRETRAHGAAWIIGRQVLTKLKLPLR